MVRLVLRLHLEVPLPLIIPMRIHPGQVFILHHLLELRLQCTPSLHLLQALDLLGRSHLSSPMMVISWKLQGRKWRRKKNVNQKKMN